MPKSFNLKGRVACCKQGQRQRSGQPNKGCCEVDCQRRKGSEACVKEQFEAHVQFCNSLKFNNDAKAEALSGGPPTQVINPANVKESSGETIAHGHF